MKDKLYKLVVLAGTSQQNDRKHKSGKPIDDEEEVSSTARSSREEAPEPSTTAAAEPQQKYFHPEDKPRRPDYEDYDAMKGNMASTADKHEKDCIGYVCPAVAGLSPQERSVD